MRDIKMSDVFALPLHHEIDLGCIGFVVDDNKNAALTCEDAYHVNRNTKAKAAAYAINNHDRLVEENEKLKAVLLYAQKECTYNEPSLSVLQRMIDEALTNTGE